MILILVQSRQLENTSLIIPEKSDLFYWLEKKNNWFFGVQYEDKLSSSI